MGTWPLIGREEELAYLAGLIADPECRGVFLAGEAGVGKTRLLAELVTALDAHHVERVTATRSARLLPFGALAQLLPEAMPADRADLLAVIAGALTRRANGKSIVLAVDDAHLLDPMSAAFVHHVAATDTAKVVLSIRSGEAAPDAIAALYRDNVLPRLELQPISRAEFHELVGAVLDGHVEPATLERLWAIAAGNVLYLRELIFDAIEAGTLAEARGSWRWKGHAGTAPRLREVVFNHIGELPDAQRHLLDLLAVAEPLSLDVVEQLAPAASLADTERSGLINIAVSGRRTEVRLGHPLFAEVLLLALPNAKRRTLYRGLADAVAATGTRRAGDLLRLAVWRLEAGDQPDAELLTVAARQANGLGDAHLAERLARLAMSGGGFEATLQLGIALSALGRHDEAEAELRNILGVEPPRQADHERLADALVLAVGLGQGRVDDAITLLIEAESRCTELQVRGLIQAHRATLLAFAARFAESATVGEAALNLVDDPATRVRAITSVGISLVMAGQIDRALEFNDEMIPIALELQGRLPRAPGWVMSHRSSALLLAGRFTEALELIEFALAALPRIDDAVRTWECTMRGRIALAQGKPATAQRHLANAVASAPSGVVVLPMSWCLSLLAEATALLGDTTQARATAQQAIDAAEPGLLGFDADERRARAWVAAAEARTSQAIAELLEAAELARSRGQSVFELLALVDALRIGEPRVARRVADLAGITDGPWAAAIGQHAEAELCDDPALRASAAAAYETMGSTLPASELLAIAAAGYSANGLRARSTEAARRSQTLATQCEGARTPLLNAANALIPLSRREREVASMAAAGASNAEIAAQLHLSVRTIESHLHSAFAKLGVTHRRHLADALA